MARFMLTFSCSEVILYLLRHVVFTQFYEKYIIVMLLSMKHDNRRVLVHVLQISIEGFLRVAYHHSKSTCDLIGGGDSVARTHFLPRRIHYASYLPVRDIYFSATHRLLGNP
jgi:hypothetical protein